MFKVNNRNTSTRCEIYSKLTIKIPGRRQWRHSGIFLVNLEYVISGSGGTPNIDAKRVEKFALICTKCCGKVK